jgi:DNA-binding IclR family transcriptional regulator
MTRQTNNSRKVNDLSFIKNYLYDSKKTLLSSKTVFRIANVLICLSHGVSSLTDIANACNVNKSTMHRLLAALCEAQIVMQNPRDQKYNMGPLISELTSNPSITHQSLIVCAANEMDSLANYTGETIGLNALIGLQQISLYEIPSIHGFRVVLKRKVTSDFHAGSTSRVLLSQLSKIDLKLVIANLEFEPLTENTITYKDQWLAHLKQTKEQGYGISYGERLIGAMTISAPIKNYLFPIALDVVGPEARVKPRVNEFIAELLACAMRIQENIKRMQKMKSYL